MREGPDHEAIAIYRRADHRDFEGAGGRVEDGGRLPQVRSFRATFYKWKTKFGGMEVAEAKRLRSLEDENAKLKKLLADAILDNAALKDLLAKKW